MIVVSICLPSDAFLQHLPSYLGFSYPGRGVSLHGCPSKVQPLLLALDEGYLLTDNTPDLERAVDPLFPSVPMQRLLQGRVVSLHVCSSKAQPLLLTLDEGYLLTAAPSDLERGIAPLGLWCPRSHRSLEVGLLLPAAAPGLRRGVAPPGRHP